MSWGTVELEPEVREWLEGLSTMYFARAAFYVDLLGEPYTKQLDGKLRELRFYLDQDAMRNTYWIAPDRRIILLTVFRKSRWQEFREVERARRAMARCRAEAHRISEGEVA
jgi:hypothetical protein